MDNSHSNTQGGGVPRHSIPPHSTKAARQSSTSQLQAQLNMQHLKQLQALNGYNNTAKSSNQIFNKGQINQSASVTPKHTTM